MIHHITCKRLSFIVKRTVHNYKINFSKVIIFLLKKFVELIWFKILMETMFSKNKLQINSYFSQ